jgi:hypothetical protein
MKQIDIMRWKEFSMSEIFEKPIRPVARRKNDYEEGSVPFVASGNFNNGIERYVTPIKGETLDSGGCITISPIDGSCFYQESDFLGRGGAGSSIIIMRPKNFKLTLGIALFLCTVLRKTMCKFQFSDMANNSSIYQETILLPQNNKQQPDWDYIEKYMANIKTITQKTVNQLISVIGGGKKRALDFSTWRNFKIGDYFKAINTGNILNREIADGSGTTPYVTASSVNNGVVAYIDASNFDIIKGNCILVGGKTFTLTYQKVDFVSNDSHNFTLYLDNNHASETIYLFMLTALRCSLSQRYSWGDAVTKDKMLSAQVLLPATHKGEPDWQYMDSYVRHLNSNLSYSINSQQAIALQA